MFRLRPNLYKESDKALEKKIEVAQSQTKEA